MTASHAPAIVLLYQLFPNLNDEQKGQVEALGELYIEWNAKINLISRKDIEHLYLHHVLHSVGISKMLRFLPGTKVIDAGTGGGFPGIPLAILFPESQFLLVDSIGKKLKACEDIASRLGLKNVRCRHSRVENIDEKCHFVVSRAAMPLSELVNYTKKLFLRESINALPNGIIVLKGGNIEGEIAFCRKIAEVDDLSSYLRDDYFLDKKVIYLPDVK